MRNEPCFEWIGSSSQTHLVVDPTQEAELSRIMPRAPEVSSSRLSWKYLQVAYYDLPAFETPEYIFSHHAICICVGAPTEIEQVVDDYVEGDRFKDGDIVFVNPAGIKRIMRSTSTAQLIYLYLDPQLVDQLAQDHIAADSVEILPQIKLRDPLIQELGSTLKAAAASNTPSDTLYAEAAATMLAAHLLRHYSSHKIIWKDYSDGLCKSKLEVITDYIEANLDQELNIDTLAQLVDMNQFHLIRLFKQSLGITPYAFIIRHRLERAKHLLKSTDRPIAEIAYATGFGSQSRFSTAFRQHVQVSPKIYREQ
jgi:AraC family transcriptional regulator